MRTFIAFCFLVVVLISCNSNTETPEIGANPDTSTSKTDSPITSQPPMDSAAMMKAWEAYMTPGDVHKMIASWDGKWTGDVTMWTAPDAPPTKSTGTAVNRMILGGRYQETKHTGTFNGMPFAGVSITGYDNAKKMFVSIWIDNFGTGMLTMEGPWDAATKTLTLKGKMVDPTTGKECEVRETFKVVDDKTQLMEMYTTLPGAKEYKSMEVKLTRK